MPHRKAISLWVNHHCKPAHVRHRRALLHHATIYPAGLGWFASAFGLNSLYLPVVDFRNGLDLRVFPVRRRKFQSVLRSWFSWLNPQLLSFSLDLSSRLLSRADRSAGDAWHRPASPLRLDWDLSAFFLKGFVGEYHISANWIIFHDVLLSGRPDAKQPLDHS